MLRRATPGGRRRTLVLPFLAPFALVLVACAGPGAAPATEPGAASSASAIPTQTTRPIGTPTPTSAAPITVTLTSPTTLTTDALIDPTLTGRASTSGVHVDAQVLANGAWTTEASTTAASDGAFTLTLAFGHGQLRTDRWRVAASGTLSSEVTVTRAAVLNPAVRTPTRADVQYSWRAGCPVSYTSLCLLDANYYGFDGLMHRGTLVVRDWAVDDFLGLLQNLIDNRFPIRTMQPVDAFKAVDEASAAADNTSAFNCRLTTLGSKWSDHSYGTAIDINPVENPYYNAGVLVPTNGKAYLDRSKGRPGMLLADGPVMKYALAKSWYWLAPTDYQHLERPR